MFDKLEAELAKAALSLPATKGFEFGSGFAGADIISYPCHIFLKYIKTEIWD